MISLYDNTIEDSDLQALADWLVSKPTPKLTKGPLILEFEKKFASFIGTKHAIFANSGSSCNLLMLYALIEDERLKNKKVVIPGLAWASDLSPVIQLCLDPILCDINMEDYSVDLEDLEKIFIEENPACLLLVSILGLSPNMHKIKYLCFKYGVILIGDHCESFGTEYGGKKLGNCGELMSSYSLFISHLPCTIEGGMICTNDESLYDTLLMLRGHGWSRELAYDRREVLKERARIKSDFDNLTTFYVPGFNLRPSEMQAFLGLRQFDRIEGLLKAKSDNFILFDKHMRGYKIGQPWPIENSFTPLFSYPIIHEKRNEIASNLIKGGIETRPFLTGNLGEQPMFYERYGFRILENCSKIMKYGLYVPNGSSLKESDIEYICNIVKKTIDGNG